MPHRRIVMLAALLLPLLAVEARAQSEAADALVSVDIIPAALSVVNTTGLDFGQAYAVDGILRSSALGIAAGWTVDVTGADEVDLSLALPAFLQGPNPSDQIVLQWGGQSGSLHEGANPPVVFDPNTGVTYPVVRTGTQFQVQLGADINNNGQGDVVINVLSASAGLHTATATLTVTVI